MNSIKQMQADRVKKFTTNNVKLTKPIINFDIETLRMIASFVLSHSNIINRQCLSNVSELFNTIDIDLFKSEPEKLKYIDVILKGTEARLVSGSENPEVILSMIRGGIITSNSVNDELSETFKTLYLLNNEEIKYINDTIESCMSYLNISRHAPRFIELLTDIEQNKTSNKIHGLIEEFNDLTQDYMSSTRELRSNVGNDIPFRLSSKGRNMFIDDFIIKSEKISDQILTGVQAFNTLIGGGLERERCYVLTGGAGVGKSMMCLNFMLQILEFNKNIKTIDPTKKPCIAYITQENSVFETMIRMLSILGCKNPTRTSKSEINQLLGKMLNGDNEPDFEIVIDYLEPGKYTTEILYDYYDNLYQEGYEIVVLIQDHIKKIMSNKYRGKGDLRLELGEVINEFKAFAVLRKCVVLTISHLNRTAETKMNDAINRGHDDPLKEVGRDAMGESYLIIDNADLCLFMHKMIDNTNQPVVCFNRIKERMECDPFIRYIVHPMDDAVLIPDLNGPSLSRYSINTESIQNGLNIQLDRNTNIHNTIGKYDEKLGRTIQESDIVKPGIKLVTMNDIFANKENQISSINISDINLLNIPNNNDDMIPFLKFKTA